jgi:hypothetical protein
MPLSSRYLIYIYRCFSLSGHTTVAVPIAECGHYNFTNNTDNCSTACSDAMAKASRELGCCLLVLLAGSSHQPLLELALAAVPLVSKQMILQ